MISISHSEYSTDLGGEDMYKSLLTWTVIMPKRYQVEAQGNTCPIKRRGESGQGANHTVLGMYICMQDKVLGTNHVSPIRQPHLSESACMFCHKGLSRKEELVLLWFFYLST